MPPQALPSGCCLPTTARWYAPLLRHSPLSGAFLPVCLAHLLLSCSLPMLSGTVLSQHA
jgi:hypothetical protein